MKNCVSPKKLNEATAYVSNGKRGILIIFKREVPRKRLIKECDLNFSMREDGALLVILKRKRS